MKNLFVKIFGAKKIYIKEIIYHRLSKIVQGVKRADGAVGSKQPDIKGTVMKESCIYTER